MLEKKVIYILVYKKYMYDDSYNKYDARNQITMRRKPPTCCRSQTQQHYSYMTTAAGHKHNNITVI
jgi:hypothetical protein